MRSIIFNLVIIHLEHYKGTTGRIAKLLSAEAMTMTVSHPVFTQTSTRRCKKRTSESSLRYPEERADLTVTERSTMTRVAHKYSTLKVAILTASVTVFAGLLLFLWNLSNSGRAAATTSRLRAQLGTIGLLIQNYHDINGVSVFDEASRTEASWRYLLNQMLMDGPRRTNSVNTFTPDWLRDPGHPIDDGSDGLTSFHSVQLLPSDDHDQLPSASAWGVIYYSSVKTDWRDNKYLRGKDLHTLLGAMPRGESFYVVNESGCVMALRPGALVVYSSNPVAYLHKCDGRAGSTGRDEESPN